MINTESNTTLKELYEDKIMLLEKLLSKTEAELERYKERYGVI